MESIFFNIRKVAAREICRMTSGSLYLLIVLVFPLLVILFFGSLFREGVPTKMPIAVVDLDQSATSRKFKRNIDVTQLSEVRMELPSVHDAMEKLRDGSIYGFIVIPAHMQADILASRQPHISFYYHNGFLIAGGLLQNDMTLILHTLSSAVSIQKREAMGQPEEHIMAEVQPVQVNVHQLFNPISNYSVYISTIVLPIMIQLFILMVTVFSIGVEIREKTSREWLRESGKSVVVALTGKMLPYTVIFFIVMLFQNFMLYRVLQVPMNTGPVWIYLNSFLFVIAYQAIGIFCIGLLPLMRHSLNLAAFYGILALTLCGFSFPVESMPAVFQLWAEGFPVRHFMHIFQRQVLAGFGFSSVFPSYIALLLFLFLPFTILNRLKSALIYQNFIENIHTSSAEGIKPANA